MSYIVVVCSRILGGVEFICVRVEVFCVKRFMLGDFGGLVFLGISVIWFLFSCVWIMRMC